MDPIVRVMQVEDLPGVVASAEAAFSDLDTRLHRPPTAEEPDHRGAEIADAILRQLLRLDAGGAFVALDGDSIVGAAMSGVREGLWYLAQLHLAPTAQGHGMGRRLLDAAMSYATSSHGMLIHSSLDPQAMGCYQRAGFSLEPALIASGRLNRNVVPATPAVRPGTPDDLDLVADLDRELRRGPHGPDLTLLLDMGARLLVVNHGPRRGYAVLRRTPLIVAASDPATAQDILWAALAECPAGHVTVHNLRADQQWAIDVAVRAGLRLAATGPICRQGDTGPMTPYLPHPALL